ncbi:unnamed protein product, partial [Nippostrongylus brasiliensis]|uniref:Protein kinase domain-containing protein n=1 Tax=Nippostrongylus brasiliensis TaxID=27835 RepID=A0A158QWH0_NIPBR
RFHHTNNIPVNGEIPLQNPIPKQKWELTNDKITLVRKVGSGQFGEVFEGIMHESPCAPPIQVAIKQTKVSEQNKAEVDEMYREARIMRQYKHKDVACRNCLIDVKKNIVKISDFGMSKQGESYAIPPTDKLAIK